MNEYLGLKISDRRDLPVSEIEFADAVEDLNGCLQKTYIQILVLNGKIKIKLIMPTELGFKI